MLLHELSGLVLNQLHAFDSNLSAADVGPPRLICIWSQDRPAHWKFIGLMPEEARAMIESLENDGHAVPPPDGVILDLAKEMARLYMPFLRFEENLIRFVPFNFRLFFEETDESLQLAFEDWFGQSAKSWLFDGKRKLCRLPSGRLVRRYISVLELLRSDDFLSQSVGWKLASLLKRDQNAKSDVSIVTDSEASYFIARALLVEQKHRVDVIGEKSRADESMGQSIAFVDAVYRGETLNALLNRLSNCRQVICCLYLPPADRPSVVGPGRVQIQSLLRFPFDPEEVPEGSQTAGDEVLEVDRVTHVPGPSAPLANFQIGTNSERNGFIWEHPELLRYGVHRSGGRIHVVNFSVADMLSEHHAKLLGWLGSCIEPALARIPVIESKQSVVLFTRSGARIRDVVGPLGLMLNERFGCRVFNVAVPSAPVGAREVFGRATPELLQDIAEVSERRRFVFAPPHSFLAIMLDDACVTGRGLLNFLIRATKARSDQIPAAIIAVPIVSRFSPAEELFFTNVCRNVHSGSSDSPVSFFFAPLFRLQVMSYDTLESTPLGNLLSKLQSFDAEYDTRLHSYVCTLAKNLATVAMGVTKEDQAAPLSAFPFYPGSHIKADPVSTQVVWIRQLLALQEQNIAILSELMHQIRNACVSRDYSLLTMLAVEPHLLEVVPLRRECRKDVLDLAVSALQNDSSVGIKSNALRVLSSSPDTLIGRLPEVLPQIGMQTELMDQFLAVLLTAVPRVNLWSGKTGEAVRSCSSKISPNAYNTIRSYAKSFEEIVSSSSVENLYEARQAIAKAVGETAYHGRGADALKALNIWLLSPSDVDRAARDGLQVQMTICEAVTVVRGALLPGMDALILWAGDREHPHAAAELRRARIRAVYALNELDVYAEGLTKGPIGPAIADQIQTLWNTVRSYTQFSSPQKYLAEIIDPAGENIGSFERWMPEFFCLPWEIASGVARVHGLQVQISFTDGPLAVVVPVALAPIKQVYNLLLADMQKHGTGANNQILFRIVRSGGISTLVALVENQVGTADSRGTGRSQQRVRQLADQHRFKVKFGDSPIPGEVYSAELSFPEVLEIEPGQ